MRLARGAAALAGSLALLAGGLAGAAAIANAATASPALPAAAGAGSGYWHTSGNQILDSAGDPVRIAGINWYGFETPDEIAHGLWAQDYHAIINDIRNLGYNTIRIPFSNQMVETPIVPQNLSFYNATGPINTDLKGLNALQDPRQDHHLRGPGGPQGHPGRPPLRGRGVRRGQRPVVHEHLHQPGLGERLGHAGQNGTRATPPWSASTCATSRTPRPVTPTRRVRPGAPAMPAPTSGWPTSRPGNAILAADPNALIFCEGISENPASSGTYNSTWWGGDLAEAGQYPVTLSSPGHVVYSAHDYGPNLFQQTWFNSSTTPASLDAVWNANWGYLYTQDIAPVWVGEFGTDNAAADVASSAAGSQGQWFESLVGYLSANPWMGWTYWALNGEDSYDLLDSNYDATPVSAAKQSLLASIQFALPGAVNGTPPPTGSAAPVSCSAAYSLTNSWAGGFQAQIVLANTGTSAISPWTLTWTFPGDQKIGSMWTASYTQSGESVTAASESYNATIAPGGSVTIGFTGTYTSSDTPPASFAVNGTACRT